MKLEQSNNSDQEPEDKELAQMSKPALIKEVRRLRKENKLLREKVAQLEEKLEEVTDKLEKGNDPHFKPNKDQPEDSSSSNSGRKKGHQGESRETPPSEEVDEEKTLDPDVCPQCGRSFQDQSPQETRTRCVEDILLPRPWRVRYKINRYYCSDCEELVKEKPEDVLPGVRLGNKLRSYILYLREELRLPDNIIMNPQKSEHRTGVDLT